MMVLFDYIFYRIYKFSKEKGDFAPETNGSLILSVVQLFTLLDILVFVRVAYQFPLPDKLFVLPVIIGLGLLNWYRYERRIDIGQLTSQWEDEERSKRTRNGWLIGIYLVVALLIPAVYGYLHVNAKLI